MLTLSIPFLSTTWAYCLTLNCQCLTTFLRSLVPAFSNFDICDRLDSRHLIRHEVTAQLVSAFVLSRLDYCNSIMANLPLYWATSANILCCCMTCSRPRTIRPCIAGVEAAALAAHWTMYPVQTVSTYASSAHQQSATSSDRDRRFCNTI